MIQTNAPIREAEVCATVIRKNGKRLSLGRVSYTHKSFLRTIIVRLGIRLKIAVLRKLYHF